MSFDLLLENAHKFNLTQIFPTPLQDLLGLSDQIQEIRAESDGRKKCHGCGKSSTSMKKCSKCSFFWYCNKVRLRYHTV